MLYSSEGITLDANKLNVRTENYWLCPECNVGEIILPRYSYGVYPFVNGLFIVRY